MHAQGQGVEIFRSSAQKHIAWHARCRWGGAGTRGSSWYRACACAGLDWLIEQRLAAGARPALHLLP